MSTRAEAQHMLVIVAEDNITSMVTNFGLQWTPKLEGEKMRSNDGKRVRNTPAERHAR